MGYRIRPADPEWAIALFFLGGLSHSLIFPQALVIHDYLVLPYAPGIAIASSIALDRAYGYVREHRSRDEAVVILSLILATVIAFGAWGTRRLHRWDDPVWAHWPKQHGEAMGRNTRPTETLLIPTEDQFGIVLLRYHSDRKLVPGINSLEKVRAQLADKVESYVFVCSNEESVRYQELLAEMEANNQSRSRDGLVLISLSR